MGRQRRSLLYPHLSSGAAAAILDGCPRGATGGGGLGVARLRGGAQLGGSFALLGCRSVLSCPEVILTCD